jgi:hypothetical protein
VTVYVRKYEGGGKARRVGAATFLALQKNVRRIFKSENNEFRLFYFPENYDAIQMLEVTDDISLSAYFNLDILPLPSLRFRIGPSTPTEDPGNSDDAASDSTGFTNYGGISKQTRTHTVSFV